MWLKASIVEEKSGRRTITPNERYTPQGGPLSRLTSNVYVNNLDHGVNDQSDGLTRGRRAVRYRGRRTGAIDVYRPMNIGFACQC